MGFPESPDLRKCLWNSVLILLIRWNLYRYTRIAHRIFRSTRLSNITKERKQDEFQKIDEKRNLCSVTKRFHRIVTRPWNESEIFRRQIEGRARRYLGFKSRSAYLYPLIFRHENGAFFALFAFKFFTL